MSERPDDLSAAGPDLYLGRFDVHVDRHGVANVSGELDLRTAPLFAIALDRIAADGGIICLDFSDLEFCGTAGINVLVAAARMLGTRGRIVIYDPSPTVARIIGITGLHHLVEIAVGRITTTRIPPGTEAVERGPGHRRGTARAVASIPCAAITVPRLSCHSSRSMARSGDADGHRLTVVLERLADDRRR